MTRNQRRPLVALLLAFAVVATATLGSAATLTVNAASISTFSVTHPCPGNATAVPSAPSGAQFTGVTVTLLSAACSGRLVQVTVLNGATVVRQGQAAASGATATVTGLTAYTAQAGYTVQATVAGWNLPTGWDYSGPTHPCPDASLAVRSAEPVGGSHNREGIEINVPAACVNHQIVVTINATWGGVLATVTVTPTVAGWQTHPATKYSVKDVANATATVDGWPLPATWVEP